MSSNSIRCESIVKSFGEPPFPVLKNLSFEIPPGQFVGITGRSGSGKSTLLYVVSGLDTLSDGRVFLGDEDIHAMQMKDVHKFRNSRVGFVFQFHYLLPELTGLENILMPARKVKKDREKKSLALSLMDQFEISHCAEKTPSQMSGGEMQRFAIARALIMDPDFLFADEPTGNLDSINGRTVMDILRKINLEHKTTILLVTHENDYAAMADRQIHLVDGQIDSDTLQKTKKKH